MTHHDRLQARAAAFSSRRLMVIALVISAFVSTISPVGAAPATVVRDGGTYAFLETGDCLETDRSLTCVLERIDVTQSRNTAQVCVYISTTVQPADGEPTSTTEFGCTSTPRTAYAVNGGLSEATLRPTVVPTIIEVCDAESCTVSGANSVTVSATWTGYDAVIRFQDQSVTHNGTCTTTYTGSGQYREATAKATIDGTIVGTSYARLTKARSTIVVTPTCPPIEGENT